MPEPTRDWSLETRCDVLVRQPAVREQISMASAQAKAHMTGEEFLRRADKIVGPLTGIPVRLSTVAKLIVPVYANLGIRTTKTRIETIDQPVGRVITQVLCSLARQGATVREIHQAEDGCVIEATMPSDFRSWAGTIVVSVVRVANSTRLDAATSIRGQMYDWGKSKAYLSRLFADAHGTGA